MAEIYQKYHPGEGLPWKSRNKKGGDRLAELIANTWEAQSGIDQVAERIFEDATAILDGSPSQRTGDSQITREHGAVDEYVNLDDRRGQWAAGVIEFGREGGGLDKNGRHISHMEAIAPLNQALPGRARRVIKPKKR